MEVTGKTVIVTGAAGGLGSATARVFASAGAKVALLDYNFEGADEIAAELGGDARAYRVDITDNENVKSVLAQVKTDFAAIHVCCNIAGGGTAAAKTYGSKGPHPADDFAKTVNLNIVGTFNMMSLVAEQMAQNEPLTASGERGVIINTASIAAYEGQMGQLSYTAGKAGIVGMTITAARDLSTLGIRVNTMVPGIMGTKPMLSVPENVKEHLLSSVEFPKRFGEPAEIGRLALFMAQSEYLNGECIRLDGALRAPAR
jgi:3-hydroxyacyl-CoA dehydrogenase/3-hydroxy-2-methylbutyryl-CoA dehydrogenase